jgi:hypothetical protein
MSLQLWLRWFCSQEEKALALLKAKITLTERQRIFCNVIQLTAQQPSLRQCRNSLCLFISLRYSSLAEGIHHCHIPDEAMTAECLMVIYIGGGWFFGWLIIDLLITKAISICVHMLHRWIKVLCYDIITLEVVLWVKDVVLSPFLAPWLV